MYEINQRFKALRKSTGLSQDQFAKRLGTGRGAITNIELNKTDPKSSFISLACDKFGVSEDWLRFGVGEMYEETPLAQEVADFLSKIVTYGDNDFRTRFISALSKLGEKEWSVLEKVAESMAAENKKRDQE